MRVLRSVVRFVLFIERMRRYTGSRDDKSHSGPVVVVQVASLERPLLPTVDPRRGIPLSPPPSAGSAHKSPARADHPRSSRTDLSSSFAVTGNIHSRIARSDRGKAATHVAMADEAAPREKVGAGEEARPLLTEAAPNTAELKDACAATEPTTSETNVDIHGKTTTLVEQIALLEALRGARRSWPQNDDKDADLRVPGDPIKTEGASTRRTRAYFVWTAIVFLLLVAVLTLQDTPQLCFQG